MTVADCLASFAPSPYHLSVPHFPPDDLQSQFNSPPKQQGLSAGLIAAVTRPVPFPTLMSHSGRGKGIAVSIVRYSAAFYSDFFCVLPLGWSFKRRKKRNVALSFLIPSHILIKWNPPDDLGLFYSLAPKTASSAHLFIPSWSTHDFFFLNQRAASFLIDSG